MRIAIVNDLPIAVEALRRSLCRVPSHSIAWVARDGKEAVEKARQDLPDLVLMDLIMPVLDGVEATRQIMAENPCPILVVTATVSGNTSQVYDAMGFGALDAVNTPVLGVNGLGEGSEALLRKIDQIELIIAKPGPRTFPTPHPLPPQLDSDLPPCIAIGASTGGPQAIAEILGQLQDIHAASILVVQHMDVEFITGFGSWLQERTPWTVELALEGDRPKPGVISVAASNDHLVLTPGGAFHYTPDPIDQPYRPSIDVLFTSLARVRPFPIGAVLLTGMGRDGAEGLLALHRLGVPTIAQAAASCVVYGMPRAAAELHAAAQILPLAQIPAALSTLLELIPKHHPTAP